MKAKHLFLAIAALLAAGGLWLGRAAWRAHRQLVTLDIPNATLGVVLRKIESQVWKKIRTEESLAGVHVTLHAKATPLPEVLDRLAAQAGARWNTLYAVYRGTPALKALDSALKGDGKLDPAGWTRIAPNPAPLAEPGKRQAGPITFERGPNGQVEMWSPQELVLESSLSNRLGNDSISTNSVPTTAAAAQTARKVDGRWTTFLAFHKTSMGIGFKMRRQSSPFDATQITSKSSNGVGSEMPGARPKPGQMHQPPIPNRRFTDFTPEQRVQLARQGHGPGG